MTIEIPAFEDSHHRIQSNSRLQSLLIGTCGPNEASADGAMHARAVVVGDNVDAVGQTASTQYRYCGFRRDCGANDVVDLYPLVEYFFDESTLDSSSGIAIARGHYLEIAAFQTVQETCIAGVHPVGCLWTREPGDTTGWCICRVGSHQISGHIVGVIPVFSCHPGGDVCRVDAVDHVDDRDVLRFRLNQQIIETVPGDRADDQAIIAFFQAATDLFPLNGQLFVATGFI